MLGYADQLEGALKQELQPAAAVQEDPHSQEQLELAHCQRRDCYRQEVQPA